MKTSIAVSFSLCIFLSPFIQADELKETADKLCSKMQQCVIEQIGAEDGLTEQIRQMATAMAKSMCESFYQVEFVMDNTELYDGMLACYQSLEKQSCSAFEDGFETPECKAFEAVAENYSK